LYTTPLCVAYRRPPGSPAFPYTTLFRSEIIITDQTRPLSQRGFGLPLIFGTTKAHPYTEYTSLAAVAEDFDATDPEYLAAQAILDRKSTRLNSSHVKISYAVFCLKQRNP